MSHLSTCWCDSPPPQQHTVAPADMSHLSTCWCDSSPPQQHTVAPADMSHLSTCWCDSSHCYIWGQRCRLPVPQLRLNSWPLCMTQVFSLYCVVLYCIVLSVLINHWQEWQHCVLVHVSSTAHCSLYSNDWSDCGVQVLHVTLQWLWICDDCWCVAGITWDWSRRDNRTSLT